MTPVLFLDMLLGFIRGPLLIFALALAVLGMMRIVLRHLMVIFSALYDAGAGDSSYRVILSSFLKNTAAAAPAFRLSISAHLKKGLQFIGFILLPLFSLDHIVLLKNILGLQYPGLSASAGRCIALIMLAFLGFKCLMSVRALSGLRGSAAELLFWMLMFILFGSGILAGSVNHFLLLKMVQALHGLSGIALLVLLPFIPVRNYLIYPLVMLTKNLGTWALPARTSREETLAYFKKLKSGS